MAWTSTYLSKMRQYWARNIAKAQYYAGSTWYDGTITTKEVQGTSVVIKFTTTDSLNLTITKIRLIDTGGEVAFSEDRSTVKKSSQGLMLQISAPIIDE